MIVGEDGEPIKLPSAREQLEAAELSASGTPRITSATVADFLEGDVSLAEALGDPPPSWMTHPPVSIADDLAGSFVNNKKADLDALAVVIERSTKPLYEALDEMRRWQEADGKRMHRLTMWNLALAGAVVLLTVALVVIGVLALA